MGNHEYPKLALRVPHDLVDRLDAMAAKMAKDPAYLGVKMTRSTLVRICIERTLAELEKSYGKGRKGR